MKDKVLGIFDPESPKGRKRKTIQEEAEDALEKEDVEALFSLYGQAIDERSETEAGLLRALSALIGSGSDDPVLGQDTYAVRAMRDVAMAAIDLAKSIGVKQQEGESEES